MLWIKSLIIYEYLEHKNTEVVLSSFAGFSHQFTILGFLIPLLVPKSQYLSDRIYHILVFLFKAASACLLDTNQLDEMYLKFELMVECLTVQTLIRFICTRYFFLPSIILLFGMFLEIVSILRICENPLLYAHHHFPLQSYHLHNFLPLPFFYHPLQYNLILSVLPSSASIFLALCTN